MAEAKEGLQMRREGWALVSQLMRKVNKEMHEGREERREKAKACLRKIHWQ